MIDIKKDDIRIRSLTEVDFSLLLKWLTDERVLAGNVNTLFLKKGY